MAQGVSHRLLTLEAQFVPQSVHVGYVVDKVAQGEVFVRVLRFPLWPSILIYYLAGINGPLVAAVQRRSFSESIDMNKNAGAT
jgi:hypothetical protein